MGKLLRAEPEGYKFLEGYPQVKKVLQKEKWLKCIQKFKGYHREVTKAFARSFKDNQVEIGDLKFTITESSLAKATSLPQTGGRWFKNRAVEDQQWKQILKNPGMDTSIFTKGIPVSLVKEEWKALLLLVQKFFTCEGRFGILYVYHAKVMMHFLGEHDINLPYFLFSSLKKMCAIVQRNPRNVEAHLYHHGLVKMLVEEQLKEKQDTWDRFLIRNHFQEIGEGSSQVPKKSRRRKREEISPEGDVHETTVLETVQEETVQEPIEENIAAHHSEHERDHEPNIDQEAREMLSETLQEIVKEATQRKRETKKKQKIDKGKAIVQETKLTPEVYITPENSSEEDTQPLASRLAQLHEAALSKKLQKQRQRKQQEKQSITTLRRSSRLQSREQTTKNKESFFIDLSTPEKGATKLDFEEKSSKC